MPHPTDEFMPRYPKIQSIFKRDPETNFRTFLPEFSRPEFAYLFNMEWRLEEKVDGTNIRIGYRSDTGLVIKGRKEKSQIPPHLTRALVEEFHPLNRVLEEEFGDGICIYGEGYGPKIQKGGGNYRSTPGFVVFDILIGPYWLRREDVEEICDLLGLDIVPTVKSTPSGLSHPSNTLAYACKLVRDGFTSHWGDFLAEGVVCKPPVNLYNHQRRRIMTKVKHCDYTYSEE